MEGKKGNVRNTWIGEKIRTTEGLSYGRYKSKIQDVLVSPSMNISASVSIKQQHVLT